MATFLVTMAYVGRKTYEVEADNADHAETIANEVARCAHFTSGYFEVEHIECTESQDLS
jgi:heme-degrading monooxygenase HmoA